MSDGAIASIVTGLVTIVVIWLRLRYGVESKIDSNTELTKIGTAQATANAKVARVAATMAATKTEELAERLNGGLDDKIRSIVKEHVEPMVVALKEHSDNDDRNMEAFRGALHDFVSNSKLQEFSDYVHKRNHDMLDAMNAQTLKMEEILQRIEKRTK